MVHLLESWLALLLLLLLSIQSLVAAVAYYELRVSFSLYNVISCSLTS